MIEDSDSEGDFDDKVDEDNQETDRPAPSRLDRLKGAKDKADKEAARWDEIEELGLPVPSHDFGAGDVTEPHQSVSLEEHSDDTQLPPAAESHPPSLTPPPRSAPSFPHPTDKPLTPLSPSSAEGLENTSPRSFDSLGEPPSPASVDAEDIRKGVKPPGGARHKRYQPPSASPDDVRLDSNGMPLPRRVPHRDSDATLVNQSAYRDSSSDQRDMPTAPSGYQQPELPATEARPFYGGRGRTMPQPKVRGVRTRRGWRRGFQFTWGTVGRLSLLGLIGGVLLLVLGGVAAAIYYSQVTAPSFEGINQVSDLQKRALQFQTTRIRDRDGNILYQINDPNGGTRQYVTLGEVSPWVIVATVATEERAYFTNPGFSIPDIIARSIQNLREGRAVAGASTITQQLTRQLLLPEEERAERSYQRKIKEIFLAAELGRRFSKKDILELYLNQIYYGNLAYGIEAAAQTYFNKHASELTFAEASFLAGLPQAPSVYDPVTNKEGALARQQQVLDLMLRAGCIDTGDTGIQVPCVTEAEITAAQPELAEIAAKQFNAPALQARYPHWVVYVQQLLENDEVIGRELYTSGFDVYTTLDPHLQDIAQEKVEITLAGLADRNVGNASVVVIDRRTGAIMAMVGSRDFNDVNIDGQVNVALSLRQPGSSIKPFTYMAALRKGWTPATVIWDVPIAYDIPGSGIYAPVNYDGQFRGPVSVRTAIANSLNVPAVQTLDFVGVPGLLTVLNDVGVTSLGDPTNPNSYGLALTLGAGEVQLLQWTNAYATLANGGQFHPTYAIERIEKDGKVLEGYPYQVPEGKQVLDPVQTYLLTSILSDKEARVPEFGRESPISPPYPAGAKTGTTNDFRDNWTMGFTSEIAVGVWVGNTDNSPMNQVTGVTGAGPIWRGIMDGSQQWYPAQPFAQPAGVDTQTVCKDDGALPSQYCIEHGEVYTEIFGPQNRPPSAEQGLYNNLRVDQFTGLIANEYCQDYVEDKFFVSLPNPSQQIDLRAAERDWIVNTDPGKAWATARGIPPDRFEAAPTESCKPDTPRPTIVIDSPRAGETFSGLLIVSGTVNAPNFSHYSVEFGLAEDPIGWGIMQPDTSQIVTNARLGQIDVSVFEPGPLTIRVIVYDTQGHHAERRVTVYMVKATPTPGPPATPVPTVEIIVPTETPTTEPTLVGETPTP